MGRVSNPPRNSGFSTRITPRVAIANTTCRAHLVLRTIGPESRRFGHIDPGGSVRKPEVEFRLFNSNKIQFLVPLVLQGQTELYQFLHPATLIWRANCPVLSFACMQTRLSIMVATGNLHIRYASHK